MLEPEAGLADGAHEEADVRGDDVVADRPGSLGALQQQLDGDSVTLADELLDPRPVEELAAHRLAEAAVLDERLDHRRS